MLSLYSGTTEGCLLAPHHLSPSVSDFPFAFHFHALEKEMATHSSVLAWRIPVTGEPGGLPSMGSHRVGYNWSDLAAAATAFLYTHLIFLLSTMTVSVQLDFFSSFPFQIVTTLWDWYKEMCTWICHLDHSISTSSIMNVYVFRLCCCSVAK